MGVFNRTVNPHSAVIKSSVRSSVGQSVPLFKVESLPILECPHVAPPSIADHGCKYTSMDSFRFSGVFSQLSVAFSPWVSLVCCLAILLRLSFLVLVYL